MASNYDQKDPSIQPYIAAAEISNQKRQECKGHSLVAATGSSLWDKQALPVHQT